MAEKKQSIFAGENFEIFKFVITLFLGWRIITLFISFLGLSVLPHQISPSELSWPYPEAGFWIRLANWDGGHFRGIAENGYLPFQVVFFPLYPLLIKALMYIQIPSLWGGLLISNLSIIVALVYLYKIILLDFDNQTAKKAVFIALAFPTAFYFGTVYSESLFLALTVMSFYYARKKIWWASLILAGLSSIVRLTGLVVIIAASMEFFLKNISPPTLKQYWSSLFVRFGIYLLLFAVVANTIKNFLTTTNYYYLTALTDSVFIALFLVAGILFSIFAIQYLYPKIDFRKFFSLPFILIIFSFIPFLGYCFYLYLTQGDFFAFVHHEEQWHRHLTAPWSAPLTYFRYLLDAGFFRIGNTTQALTEFIFFVIFLILFFISLLKLRVSYSFYFALSLLLPIATGTLQAIHRYGLVIFPIFIILALIKNETYYHLWLYFSLTLLGIFTVLFINSYWVS